MNHTHVAYRQLQQGAISFPDQLTAVEHRFPSVPMKWSPDAPSKDPAAVLDHKKKRRSQLREGQKKSRACKTEAAKKVEKMKASRASMDTQAKEVEKYFILRV